MKKSCWWRHDYNKWKETGGGDILIDGRIVGIAIIQERICKRCGYKEIELQKERF